MRPIGELLAEHPFFAGLAPEVMGEIVGCAQNVHVRADSHLFREGEPADTFYVIRHGRVALELAGSGGRRLLLETVDDEDVVGWSWLVPPYRWFCDARATADTSAIAIDGACLRGKCDADPELGYQLLQRVAGVMLERLQAARVRLLDVYGVPSGETG